MESLVKIPLALKVQNLAPEKEYGGGLCAWGLGRRGGERHVESVVMVAKY